MAPLSGSVVLAGLFVVLLGLSAFFSSSETAIFSLPQDWTGDTTTTDDDREVATLTKLRTDPHRLLVTLLVGNNVVNIAISSVATATLLEVLPSDLAVPVATVVVSALVLVFGEIVPKSYGLGNAEDWALSVARPIRAVAFVLSPLVTAFDLLTRWISGLIGGKIDIEEPYLDGED